MNRMPELETDRVERMRSAVMDAIAADERRARSSRRRTRLALAAGTAAAVAVIGGIGVTGALDRPGDGSADSATSADVAAAPETAYEGQPGSRDQLAPADPDLTDPAAASTLVVTGSIQVVVDDVDGAARAVSDLATARGGRLDDQTLDTSGDRTSASLTVRIPAGQVDGLRDELDRLGTVGAVNIARADVAAQVADVDARIDSLQTSITRLRTIIGDAGSTKDLLDAENQLAQRQAELESLQAQQRVLRDQTSLAAIQVSLTESESAAAVEPSGFVGGLTRGWNALAATANTAVTLAGVLTPWLLPLAALTGLAVLVRRRA